MFLQAQIGFKYNLVYHDFNVRKVRNQEGENGIVFELKINRFNSGTGKRGARRRDGYSFLKKIGTNRAERAGYAIGKVRDRVTERKKAVLDILEYMF